LISEDSWKSSYTVDCLRNSTALDDGKARHILLDKTFVKFSICSQPGWTGTPIRNPCLSISVCNVDAKRIINNAQHHMPQERKLTLFMRPRDVIVVCIRADGHGSSSETSFGSEMPPAVSAAIAATCTSHDFFTCKHQRFMRRACMSGLITLWPLQDLMTLPCRCDS